MNTAIIFLGFIILFKYSPYLTEEINVDTVEALSYFDAILMTSSSTLHDDEPTGLFAFVKN